MTGAAKFNVRGFTLLEVIGVMAVLAILAGALAPTVFQTMQEGYRTAEKQSLANIHESLVEVLQRDKRFPTETLSDWRDTVADYMSVAPSQVEQNSRNYNRRLYVDPMFFTATNQVFPGFTQTQGLTSTLNSPRAMLVSSLTGNVNTNISTHAQFQLVWEQGTGALLVESPDLLIERINLASEFVQVLLSNASTDQAGYQLDGATEGAVAAAAGAFDGNTTLYVVAGTKIELNEAPYPGGGTLRTDIIDRSDSFRYEFNGAAWVWSK